MSISGIEELQEEFQTSGHLSTGSAVWNVSPSTSANQDSTIKNGGNSGLLCSGLCLFFVLKKKHACKFRGKILDVTESLKGANV